MSNNNKNHKNHCCFEGRLAADPAIFTNKDGSVKAKFTLMCEDNYRDKSQRTSTQTIRIESFLPPEKAANKNVYEHIHKGDLVSVAAVVRQFIHATLSTSSPDANA